MGLGGILGERIVLCVGPWVDLHAVLLHFSGACYTIDPKGWEVQRVMGMQGKDKHSRSHVQTLESQPLAVVTAVTMETPGRLLKATRSSTGSVLPF